MAMSRSFERTVGIDPGLRLTGYAVVDRHAVQREPILHSAGVIRLDASTSIEDRLTQLFADLTELLDEVEPDTLAVEKLYAHYRHPTTAILMGHARGVILLAARQRRIPVEHLPSTEVKKAITGYGHASKEQMQRSIQMQCGLAEPPKPPDVADAIAIALTFARRHTLA